MSRILVFSRTLGYRHESIPRAAEVLAELAALDGHDTDHTEDPAVMHATSLDRYALVVWLSTSGEVLDAEQRAAFAAWLSDGGRYAGVHSATACEYEWPEYERIAGAFFDGHPDVQPATVRRTAALHPSTAGLPDAWTHTDEWYNFRRRPSADHTVLLTVDEASYDGGTMGADHPVAWHGTYRGHRAGGEHAGSGERGADGDGQAGRTWYTALGHSTEGYDDPLLRAHLLGGLRSLID